jgi:hypothetical protein
MLHLLRDEPQCATAAMVPFDETGRGKSRDGSKNPRDRSISRRNRQFDLGIEEMHVKLPQMQNAPAPANRGRCASSKAYCLASSLFVIGLPVFSNGRLVP